MKLAYEAASTALASMRDYISTIQFWSPKLDRLWIDVALAQDGDVEAARRLSTKIKWKPNQWQQEAIRIRARDYGKPPLLVQPDCLAQGVLLALGWQGDRVFPLLVQPQSTWVYNDKTLSSLCPKDLPTPTFWEWIREEVARAAGFWLVDQSYAPTVILAEPPGEEGELRLAKFASALYLSVI